MAIGINDLATVLIIRLPPKASLSYPFPPTFSPTLFFLSFRHSSSSFSFSFFSSSSSLMILRLFPRDRQRLSGTRERCDHSLVLIFPFEFSLTVHPRLARWSPLLPLPLYSGLKDSTILSSPTLSRLFLRIHSIFLHFYLPIREKRPSFRAADGRDRKSSRGKKFFFLRERETTVLIFFSLHISNFKNLCLNRET